MDEDAFGLNIPRASLNQATNQAINQPLIGGTADNQKRMRKSDAPLYMLLLFILVLVVLTLSEIAMVKHSGGVVVGRGGFHMTKKVSQFFSSFVSI